MKYRRKNLRKNLTKEQKEAIIADLPNMQTAEIVKKYSVSCGIVYYYRQKYHIYCHKEGREITQDTVERVCELRKNNELVENIMRKTNLPKYQVQKILSENGFPIFFARRTSLTKELATPMFYGNRSDSFQLEDEHRARYEQLKRWKEQNYFDLLNRNT